MYHTLVENGREGRGHTGFVGFSKVLFTHSSGNCRCREVERGGTLEADSIWIESECPSIARTGSIFVWFVRMDCHEPGFEKCPTPMSVLSILAPVLGRKCI